MTTDRFLLTYVTRVVRLDQSMRITRKNDTGCFTMGSNFYACLTIFNRYAGVKEFCINAQPDSTSVADIIVEML